MIFKKKRLLLEDIARGQQGLRGTSVQNKMRKEGEKSERVKLGLEWKKLLQLKFKWSSYFTITLLRLLKMGHPINFFDNSS